MTQRHFYLPLCKKLEDIVDQIQGAAPNACGHETENILIIAPYATPQIVHQAESVFGWEHLGFEWQNGTRWSLFIAVAELEMEPLKERATELKIQNMARMLGPNAALHRQVYIDADEGDLPAIEDIFYP